MSLRSRPTASGATAPAAEPESPKAPPPPPPPQGTLPQILDKMANLNKLLPTGTIVAFQLLTPLFTNNGACDSATRPLTLLLLFLLALTCFAACFTDSIRDEGTGRVYYGIATRDGMRLLDYDTRTPDAAVPDLWEYRLRLMDGVHAVLSVLVFAAVALRDKNVVSCFYPTPAHETEEVLDIVPIGIGMICSLLFVAFPSRRHGIGFSVPPSAINKK